MRKKLFGRKLSVFVLVGVMLSLVACASFVRNSYISLDGTAVTYSAAVVGAKAAFAAGKITQENWAKVVQGGTIFDKSFDVAVDGLIAYKNNPATTTQEAFTYAIQQSLANWMDLAALINSILPGAVPVSSLNSVKLRGKMVSGQRMTVTIKKLDTGEISMIIQIGTSILQFLIPAVQSLVNDLGKITISDADILALKDLVKPPDQY